MRTMLLATAALALSQTSCSTLPEATKDKLSSTAEVLAGRAADITKNMVVNYAIEKAGIKEGDFLWGLTEGLRTIQTENTTGAAVEKLIAIWVPKAPPVIGQQLASAFNANPAPPTEKIEAIIAGVTKVAKVTKT